MIKIDVIIAIGSYLALIMGVGLFFWLKGMPRMLRRHYEKLIFCQCVFCLHLYVAAPKQLSRCPQCRSINKHSGGGRE